MAEGGSFNFIKTTEKNKDGEETPLDVSASPPKKFKFEDYMQMKAQVEGMILTHESAIQENFKLEKTEVNPESLEGKIKTIMEKAYWDVLKKELESTPPIYYQALKLLSEIKQELLNMLPPNSQTFEQKINEFLDMELINQKLQHSIFDFPKYSEFIVYVLSRLCAPVRDVNVDKIRNLLDHKDPILLYKEIFKLIELMKLDLANYTLSMVKPIIKQQSSQIEKKKFFEILKIQQENGVDGLACTKKWLSSAVKSAITSNSSLLNNSSFYEQLEQLQLKSSEQRQQQMQQQIKERLKLYRIIMVEAYLNLIKAQFPIPETLLMDNKRIIEMKDKFGSLLLVATTLAIVASCVSRRLSEDIKTKLKTQILILTEKVNVKDYNEVSLAIIDQVMKEITNWFYESATSFTSTTLSTIDSSQIKLPQEMEVTMRDHLKTILDPSIPPGPVFKLMSQRLFEFIFRVLSEPDQTEVQIPQGYSSLTEELKMLVKSFTSLVNHNLNTYNSIYNDLIHNIIVKNHEKIELTKNNEAP